MIHAKAINHLGIAVRCIEEHREYYEKTLGATYQGTEEVAEQKVKVAFFLVGEGEQAVRLELLEPTSDDSPIASFLEKRGEGLHHVAYTVENIEQRLANLAAGGVRLIDTVPRSGAHETRIAFLHPKATKGVLTELTEPGTEAHIQSAA